MRFIVLIFFMTLSLVAAGQDDRTADDYYQGHQLSPDRKWVAFTRVRRPEGHLTMEMSLMLRSTFAIAKLGSCALSSAQRVANRSQ